MIAPPIDELACQALVELVTAYLEGALDPGERARFDAHLAECDACVAYVDQIRRTIRLSGTLRREAIDPAVERAMIAAFRTFLASLPPASARG